MESNMAKLTVLLIGLIALALSGSIYAQDYRLIVEVEDITAAPDDTLIAVPVYITHPIDTLAGAEIYLVIDDNKHISFASDDTRADGMLVAADTAGTILSGWEYLGAQSMENTIFDLKVAGLADWPDQVVTQPAMPTTDGLLVMLYFRQSKEMPVEGSVKYDIRIDPEKTSFATPLGTTIGIMTMIEKVCSQYVGDSCVAWKNVKVGKMDTSVVHFKDGSITIKGEPGTKE
jgi:hypothetical protein